MHPLDRSVPNTIFGRVLVVSIVGNDYMYVVNGPRLLLKAILRVNQFWSKLYVRVPRRSNYARLVRAVTFWMVPGLLIVYFSDWDRAVTCLLGYTVTYVALSCPAVTRGRSGEVDTVECATIYTLDATPAEVV